VGDPDTNSGTPPIPQDTIVRQTSFFRHVCAAVLLAVPVIAVSTATAPEASAATSAEQQMASRVNQLRAAHGKPPLALHAGMSDDSRAWSSRMASAGLAHDPGYSRSCSRLGSYSRCAENVGYASSTSAVQANLEASSGHRSNMLCDCTHMGIGIVVSGGRTFATQRFVAAAGGAPAPAPAPAPSSSTSPSPTPSGSTAPAPAPAPSISPAEASALAYLQAVAATDYLKAAYPDFVDRDPSSSDLGHWVPRLQDSGDRAVLVRALAYSAEALSPQVESYYEDALGRPADPAGRHHWVALLRVRAVTPADVVTRLYASEERFADEGGDLADWVDGLYGSILGRPSDDGGRAHWVALARREGRRAVVRSLYDSTESVRERIDGAYRRLLGRPADHTGEVRWAGLLRLTGNDVDLARGLAGSVEYSVRASGR
jgi:uncharacterized protein YkwD